MDVVNVLALDGSRPTVRNVTAIAAESRAQFLINAIAKKQQIPLRSTGSGP